MAEEQDGGRGFRVQDRRRFSPDTGEPRVSEPEAEEESTKESAKESRQSTPADHQDRLDSDAPQDKAQPPPQLSFSSFILGLSTQALIYMGEITSSEQTATTDLSAAQEMIDIIAMLQHKTAGNLDRGENEMLDTVLFDLRMRYVALANKRQT